LQKEIESLKEKVNHYGELQKEIESLKEKVYLSLVNAFSV
jgi:hypothetical protein